MSTSLMPPSVNYRSSVKNTFIDFRRPEVPLMRSNSLPFRMCSEGGEPLHSERTREELPSLGSALHGKGKCTICSFLYRDRGCSDGTECLFCHLCPPEKYRKGACHVRKRSIGLISSTNYRPFVKNTFIDFRTPVGQLKRAQSLPFFSLSCDDRSGECPSLGSALHSEGKCTVCSFFYRDRGCSDGTECLFCHLCPEEEYRKLRKTDRRMHRNEHTAKTDGKKHKSKMWWRNERKERTRRQTERG